MNDEPRTDETPAPAANKSDMTTGPAVTKRTMMVAAMVVITAADQDAADILAGLDKSEPCARRDRRAVAEPMRGTVRRAGAKMGRNDRCEKCSQKRKRCRCE